MEQLATKQHRVLFVDDEPRILEGIKRLLRGDFEVDTAVGAAEAMLLLRKNVYAVVVSDLRMPGTDGIAFLATVRRAWPDSVRMLLTGFGDVDSAMKAVNDNQVFRFFRKPCPPTTLIGAVKAGIEQYELVIGERELLEGTLQGCLHALADVLAMTSPLAFARAVRVRECVGGFAERFGIPNKWQYEVAAMLSQLGSASLPKDLAEKVYFGRELTPAERDITSKLPATAANLIAHVPRLENVREIMAHLDQASSPHGDAPAEDAVPLGSLILRVAFDFDVLLTQGLSVHQALKTLIERGHVYDPDVLEDFSLWQGEALQAVRTRDLELSELQVGMILAVDVVTETGVLLIARGQRVTPRVIDLVHNYWSDHQVRDPVRVYLVEDAPAEGGQKPDATMAAHA